MNQIRKQSGIIILLVLGLALTACSFVVTQLFQSEESNERFQNDQLISVNFSPPITAGALNAYVTTWSNNLIEIRTGYAGRDGGIGVYENNLGDTLSILRDSEEAFFKSMFDPEARLKREQGIVEAFPPEVAKIFLQGEVDRAAKLSSQYSEFKQYGTPIKGAIFAVHPTEVPDFQNYWTNVVGVKNGPSITFEFLGDGS